MQLLWGHLWSWLHEWRRRQQLSVPVSELESGFPGRLWTFGAEGGYWGWTRRPSCLHCVTGTCCEYIPLWNLITHLTRGKTNCYRRESLHLNQTTFRLKGKRCWLKSPARLRALLFWLAGRDSRWNWKVRKHQEHASISDASAEVTGGCSSDLVRGFLSNCC